MKVPNSAAVCKTVDPISSLEKTVTAVGSFFMLKENRLPLLKNLQTSVGKRSLIINLSMIVTTSNIPERIANFVSIFN